MRMSTALFLACMCFPCFMLGMVFGSTVFVKKMHEAQCEQMEND